MNEPRNALLYRRLDALCEQLAGQPAASDLLWREAARDYATTEAPDEQVAAALAARDVAAFQKILAEWTADRRPLPIEDRTLLKRAMKAFRKRLKMTRLDDESRLGVGATTKGHQSGVVGITPPHEFPSEVWEELARQGRLKADRHGVYELVD